MKRRIILLLCILILCSCSQFSDSELPTSTSIPTKTLTQQSAKKFTSTATRTPGNTIAPSATKTITITSSPTYTKTPIYTPTETELPESFRLKESGYDIAGIQITYPEEDTMHVHFRYRLLGGVEKAIVEVFIPANCRTEIWRNPGTQVNQSSGESFIEFKMPLEGECVSDFLFIGIRPIIQKGAYWFIQELAYQERFDIEYSVTRNYPSMNSRTAIMKDFNFEKTGSWAGIISFEYWFSGEIPIEKDRYLFTFRGIGGGGACEFQNDGAFIEGNTGVYTIDIQLPRDLMGNDCTEQFSSYFFNESLLWLKEFPTNAPSWNVMIFRFVEDFSVILSE